ncbi:ATP-binding protein [Nocardia arizonensis]|uniref:ATP-binding protein n=1 Tax=Nocardia arizonensis TaxID=1141647 RepID=UPI0006D2A79D|nr:ATP-binding protein [Nocardia arizonensis]
MESSPRSRQFRLSNWSVTRKVGVVLLLPVVLASTFAVLRINDELAMISQLDGAAAQARLLRPMLGYGAAAEQLAVTAVTSGASSPDIDNVGAKFDQAAADLETTLRTLEPSNVTKELTASLAAGRNLRNGLRSSSPVTIAEQVGEVGTRIINATSVSSSIEEIVIQRYFLQLGLMANASRLLTQEYIMVSTLDAAGNNQAVKANLLTTLGAEIVVVNIYAQLSPDSAANASALIEAVQTRIGAFAQNANASDNPVIQGALDSSVTGYRDAKSALLDLIDVKLADRTAELRSVVLRDIAIVVATLLAGLVLALAVARSLVVPIRRLRHGALQVAHVDLPNEIEVVRSGGSTPDTSQIDIDTTEEIGQLARAVDDIHLAALHLAGEQARLRLQIGSMFETLSRRSQSLVEQQLTLIEELEHDEDDSDRLQSLFRLDHLATRMRRNGDNLLVLAGTALRRGHLPPVPLSDMLWSAVSQVEDYQRVEIGTAPDGIVPGEPAVDIEHLLAELIDNALRYSPPTTPVAVSVARAVDGGYLIEIIDRGLGMSNEDLKTTNDHLASGGEVTVETARRMGLFVVGRLAKRHNITVNLRRTSAMAQQPGITASVHLPGTLVSPVPMSPENGPQHNPPLQLASPAATAPQPRMLVPVPSPALPEHTSSYEVSSSPTSSLPQRRPAIRVAAPADRENTSGSSPVIDIEATDPGRLSRPFRDDRARPAEPPALSSSDSYQSRSAEPAHVDVWAETSTYAPVSAPRAIEPEPISTAVSPTTTATGLRPVTTESPTPIYQRMVSEWLVEPSSSSPEDAEEVTPWTSPADAGWAAAAEASNPTTSGRTSGGLPIRQPGAQLVPGGLSPVEEANTRNPEEIRNSLTRHLSGVRSGRADAQYNDGGLA